MPKKTPEIQHIGTEQAYFDIHKGTRAGFNFYLRDNVNGGPSLTGTVERIGKYNLIIRTVGDKPRHLLIYKSAILYVEPLPADKQG
jgi:sRNA-binding regulator protein Hfq